MEVDFHLISPLNKELPCSSKIAEFVLDFLNDRFSCSSSMNIVFFILQLRIEVFISFARIKREL